MNESESLKATFKRLELQQKTEEDAEACFCGYAEKLHENYFAVTRRCRLDGCSCANFSQVDLVETCPTRKKKDTLEKLFKKV